MKAGHLPVLAEEVIEMLAPAPGSLQIDATLGGGGHTERILEATDPDGRLLGLDADGAAIARVADRLRPRFGDRLVLRQANFRELGDRRPGRRLRRRRRLPLRPRAVELPARRHATAASASGPAARSTCASTPSRGVPAAELLATLDAAELTALFRRYGEEPKAPRIARAIVDARRTAPVATAEELAALVERVAPPNPRQPPPDPPGDARLPGAADRGQRGARGARRRASPPRSTCSGPGGRLVVLSYHSLEDRIVKRFFAAERRGCVCPPELPVCVCGRNPRLRLVTRPSLTPVGGGDRRQPTRPERPPAGRRAPRRLGQPVDEAGEPAGGPRRHQQRKEEST